ncbi:N-acetylated-alpha-linked acidic dipeptidase-like protein [Merluccius polli]|uniref:Aminopeptidase NAALADL1 n=1 Tax=Merluccius polli TaxID=89951 RepID=A0AA47MVF7_MERPO|nr:N-acetylated-alpha-linked acidic dipeptidase-like protein [Merluccius polli]
MTVLHTAREREKSYGPDQEDPAVVQPYAAYSPAGQPQVRPSIPNLPMVSIRFSSTLAGMLGMGEMITGKLVYANQGKPSDYMRLNETLDLRGTIAITRYGGAGRAAKAINAAPYGVAGVLVYTDPLDINDGLMSDANETYPHSWYMPPSGVERGSFSTKYGDLLTPYLAAKDMNLPLLLIGYHSQLGGEAAPTDWQGGFNCTYNFGGPGFKPESEFKDSDVKLEVFNYAEQRNSSNVMGIIRGSVEPDRYVIYGNHRDSWVHGAIDPSSGTSVMLEVTRVLGRMLKQGRWRPRRSIIFGSWGAEEFGLIGSAEYTEVKAPGLESMSVYDNWIRYFNRTSPAYGTIPRVRYLSGAGSDYAGFVHYLGITSMDIAYTYDQTKTKARIYPAYHTAYDTFDYASRYIDPGFTSHQAVARTAGNVLLRLADSLLLPLNCSDYAESLEGYLATAVELYQTALTSHSISMEPLKSAVVLFRSAATQLDQFIHGSDLANETPLKVRRFNDQLMLLDRAFLDPQAFPEKYGFRHVIWASSSAGKATFPGLADAFARASSSGLARDWATAHHQLSILSQAIEGAAHTLLDVPSTSSETLAGPRVSLHLYSSCRPTQSLLHFHGARWLRPPDRKYRYSLGFKPLGRVR